MSPLPIPTGLKDSRRARVANGLHSIAIHLLRRARIADRETGLSPERLSLLSVLVFAGPKTVGELAAAEMVSPPAISRTLKSLDQLGLTQGTRSERDARRVLVQSTEAGRALMESGRRRRLERIVKELERLNDKEIAVLEAAIGILESLEKPDRA